MELRSRHLAPATFGSVAFLIIAASPCTVRASSGDDDERDLDVPEPAEVCLSCHALKAGEPEMEGPSLWGVVGRPVASLPNYEYSEALRQKGGNWTRERPDRWIAGPAAITPGTKMTLGGVRSAADRKVVLDFLETLRDRGDATAEAAESGTLAMNELVPESHMDEVRWQQTLEAWESVAQGRVVPADAVHAWLAS